MTPTLILENDRLTAGIRRLLQEHARSVMIHSDWSDYRPDQCFEAVEDEFLEFRRAHLVNDVDGPHGLSAEALQLAVVAFKAHIYFENGGRTMAESLREKQSRFALMVAELLLHAHELGYTVTLGEAYRSADEAKRLADAGKGITHSLHTIRLAVDLNLFRDGIYLKDTDSYRPLGEWWESQGGAWGGRSKDGNHFSLEHEGRK